MRKSAKSLSSVLDDLERQFTVSQDKLKQIVDRFIQELEDGLRQHGSNIPMNLTWVMGLPTGDEKGTYLALDMGGTNLRVCKVTLLDEKGKYDLEQSEYRMPEEMKTGTAEEMYNQIGESLEQFLEEHHMPRNGEKVPLAFTFSYPTTQDRIDHGVLQTWTKGLEIKGVEGEDVAAQLRTELEKRDLPIKLVALINDTTGALMASAYRDPEAVIGCIFGTGCNGAYIERCDQIPKARDRLPQDKDAVMAINCEYGAFDNSLQVLPRTKYDDQIDQESPKPGEQSFEKMSAGYYLGEILRLVLLDLQQQGLIFKHQPDEKLREPYVLDTAVLSGIENDESKDLSEARKIFKEHLNIEPTAEELNFAQKLSIAIAVRGARLSACGVAAICKKRGINHGHVAADGSVVNKHPKFKQRWARALGEILSWPALREKSQEQDGEEAPVVLVSAEDGSGVGAAVIAAITLQQGK